MINKYAFVSKIISRIHTLTSVIQSPESYFYAQIIYSFKQLSCTVFNLSVRITIISSIENGENSQITQQFIPLVRKKVIIIAMLHLEIHILKSNKFNFIVYIILLLNFVNFHQIHTEICLSQNINIYAITSSKVPVPLVSFPKVVTCLVFNIDHY